MSIARVEPPERLHTIPVNPHLGKASSLFHNMGGSFKERQTNDAGIQMEIMTAGFADLGSLVPYLSGPPPVDGGQPALEPRDAELLSGSTLAALSTARVAVNQHWLSAVESASQMMQDTVNQLTSALTPSWKEHLEPSASWQMLIDSCSDTLGNTDAEAIMACVNQAKKARIRDKLSPQQQPHQHVTPFVPTAQDVSTFSPSRVCTHHVSGHRDIHPNVSL